MEEFEKFEILDFYSPIDYYSLIHISQNYNDEQLNNEMKTIMKYENHKDLIIQIFGILKIHKHDIMRIIRWIGDHHPTLFRHSLQKLLFYIDDWDIVLRLLFDLKELPRCFLLYSIKKIYLKDTFSLSKQNKETMSGLCLSLPRERSSFDKRTGFVSIFCDELGISRKKYRKQIVEMKQTVFQNS